ncbi:uncharacterized protein LOC127258980 isoform X2 [Andrographis paniculata]|nr:uncharacterized protein LOC127258980 isoform X2 [Andrographis paniculata]XP_051142044.1 uncharacterized protein LOC127258980 isoform X2 [Andrographis paniculata]
MKMHIDQEMLKEVNSRHDPPNLVAKLMGLDTLPEQEPDAVIQKTYSRVRPRSRSEIPACLWQKQQNGYINPVNAKECQDFYDIWQQPQKPPNKGRYKEAINEKQMAFVRQKFIEAKRLSMDEKLHQSKQFQDALEVLSSNKDLFLKCLQEPISMLRQQSVPPPTETKRITVLRPSKMPDSNKFTGSGNIDRKQMKKAAFLRVNGAERTAGGSPPPTSYNCNENPAQPTRIVVLKPSPGRQHNLKAVSPQSEAQRLLRIEDLYGDIEDDENKRSRKVAKEITQQMREKLGKHRRDETLISSVYSNGFVGDESSFSKSEIEHADGNLSDSEVMSPVSGHSWDCANRLGSPYSSSPFSRASYSPESSVCREAKRRLSERWTMMASNGSRQKHKQVQRNSSTLGEMLALSEASKPGCSGEGCSTGETKDLDTFLVSELREDNNVDSSPRNLTRSKSVPVSCTEFGVRLNAGIAMSDKAKREAPNEDTKAKGVRSSFRGKVSNLFFSRNRKPDHDISLEPEINNELELCNDRAETLGDNRQGHSSPGVQEPSVKLPHSNLICRQDLTYPEASLAVARSIAVGNQGEKHDQPSPISVLDQPFEEDAGTAHLFTHFTKPIQQGVEFPRNASGSNLIDKSPPIGSIARTLSWEDSCVDAASSFLSTETLNNQGRDERKQEWYSFIQALLSAAGLHGELQSSLFFTRWHSPESPLDPSLRDKYIQEKETLHEAKRRQLRSTQKLVFDCVNVALSEVAGYGAYLGQRTNPCIMANNHPTERGSSSLVDEVWARMNALFSDNVRCLSDDCGDDNSGLVVESVVRKEVAGKGWTDHLNSEMDILRQEIEESLLAELMDEAVVELTGRL